MSFDTLQVLSKIDGLIIAAQTGFWQPMLCRSFVCVAFEIYEGFCMGTSLANLERDRVTFL